MHSKPQHDLSDNAVRGSMLAKLIQATSQKSSGIALQAWEPDAQHPDPPTANAALAGAAWKLHNDLRVMAQYTRVLRESCSQSPFLLGTPTTCVEGLEWFHSFAQPVNPLAGQEFQLVRDFVSACALHQGGNVSPGEAAFEAHRSIAKPDRQLTQFLVEHHFPGKRKQFELDVCAYMLARPNLTYAAWKEDFPKWREKGLYYCLGLASVYMPTLDCWLPAEAHESKVATSLDACLERMRVPGHDHLWVVHNLSKEWNKDATGAADVLSGKLDRLAILMGVKSNGDCFELAEALASFEKVVPGPKLGADPTEFHTHNFHAWSSLKKAIEATFPPSLLSAPLVRPKRDTWGHERLHLKLKPGKNEVPVVCFTQQSLQHIRPVDLAQSSAHTYQPAFVKDCMLHQTSQRLQEVLWRLGEIATSQHVAACMLRPDVGLCSLSPHYDPSLATEVHQAMTVTNVMLSMDSANSRRKSNNTGVMGDCFLAYMQSVDAFVPRPVSHFLPCEQAALFWRLDTPPRAILCIGAEDDADPFAQSRHHLEKVMVNCKVPHRPTGGILRVPCSSTEEAVREALRAFARAGLSTHPANTVLLTHSEVAAETGAQIRQVAPATCTTLAESVACFTLTRPQNLTNCQLGGSSSWKEDGIDPRYAERQLAENGFRFRDWTAMYVGNGGTQQSRLASHMVKYDCLHTTVIPWFLEQGGISWVQFSSTLPPEPRTLHGKSLRQAVEARFLHDLRMLPTEEGGRVIKSNCEVYTDMSGAVGIVYCQEGSSKLHFACFQCGQ